jgi:hypothetical protein
MRKKRGRRRGRERGGTSHGGTQRCNAAAKLNELKGLNRLNEESDVANERRICAVSSRPL